METLEVRFKKLREDAVIPSYAHDGDLGMDMAATSIEYNAKFIFMELKKQRNQ